MSLRTVQLLGRAYSPDGTDLTLSCLVNGQETHGTTVPTEIGPTPDVADVANATVLMTFGVDHTEFTAGNIPVIITPTGGDVIFTSFYMNHQGIELDPLSTSANVIITKTPEQAFYDINQNSALSDGKNNVKLDNVLITDRENNITEDPSYEEGEWYYLIPDGSTLTLDFVVDDVPYVQQQEFTGDGVTTVFQLVSPVSSFVAVVIDGVQQATPLSAAGITFDDVNDTITFATAPANGASIIAITSGSSTEA